MTYRRLIIAAFLLSGGVTFAGAKYDLAEVQGTLAVQGLDGWLFYDHGGENPIAVELISPTPRPQSAWFYFVPAQGRPIVICHQSDAQSFGDVAVRPYGDTTSRDRQLLEMLRGLRQLAMEYQPQSKIKSLNRVPASIVKEVSKSGVKVVSSAQLVQFTKSLWRRDGRVSHYVAAHHLDKLFHDALHFMGTELGAGRPLTELDVQRHIESGYAIRGIKAAGHPPIVAAGENSANPDYVPSDGRSRKIVPGDVVRLTLSAVVAGPERAIAANLSWTAYVGDKVPEEVERSFAAVVAARKAVLDLLRTRLDKRQSVLGYEADDVARLAIADAGFAANLAHRTGHSLDTSIRGAGANLDSAVERDSRPLVRGAGFTIEPGLYVSGRYGVKTEINVFLGNDGVEVTGAGQDAVALVRVP